MPRNRRDDLIEAAMRVFCRTGVSGGSVDDVIREAGVSRMTLYNHFDSKEDLAVAAMERQDERFRAHVAEEIGRRADDPVGQILAIFDVLGEWYADDEFNGCGFARIAAEIESPENPMRQLAVRHKERFCAMIEELCRRAGAEEPAILAQELCLLMDGATSMAVIAGHEQVADRAKSAARKLLDT